MKKLFVFLLCLFATTAMMANNVSEDEAANIALKFLNQQRLANGSRRVPQSGIALHRVDAPTAEKAFYAFNIGTNDGFVLVNGSDMGPQVLGYANEGSLDPETMPSNMKAWLQGYADQIAYMERTHGANHRPVLRRAEADVVEPLLKTKWGQRKPYNQKCPTIGNDNTLTGCVATSLAQVLYYYKYPAATLTEIPAYTSGSISMPALPVTTIDWAYMKTDYSVGSSSPSQKNAVATLMQLCGQAVEMQYGLDASSSSLDMDVVALKKYFGYDETVQHLRRNELLASQWETIIYNELANGRPVLYGGKSTGGGHAFVIDGYDGDGKWHVNWGWNGTFDGYFELAVLNPYREAGETRDGYSFDQDIVIGIQHSTGEEADELLSVTDIRVSGSKTFTRSSASQNFTGINISTVLGNYSGDTHDCYFGLYIIKDDGTYEHVLYFDGGEYIWDGYRLDNYQYLENYPFNNIVFGADLADGDYTIYPVGWTDDYNGFYLLWGADTYNIRANISGNKLTLSEPVVSLSGSVTATGSQQVNTAVPLRWEVKNNGTFFNNYAFLRVDGTVVGGRILQAVEGQTTAFNIDFVPTTTGTKKLELCYRAGNDTIPFATGSVVVENGAPQLTGSIAITNAVSTTVISNYDYEVVVGSKVDVSAIAKNVGDGDFAKDSITVDLYKYDESGQPKYTGSSKGIATALAPNQQTSFSVSFDNLEVDAIYALVLSAHVQGDWPIIGEEVLYFTTVESFEEPVVSDISQLANAIYVEPSTGKKGGEGVLRISLKNNQETNAYSLDLALPEGVSLVSDGYDGFLYELSSRHNGHAVTVNYQPQKGVYSFAVLSLQSRLISGNDGTILTLPLQIDERVAAGNYEVVVSNAKYSLPSGATTVQMPSTAGVLTIEDYTLGDVNDDGDVDVADAVCIVNHVVGKDTPVFEAKAADVNGDGDVDVADAVRIINLVVGKIPSLAPKKAPAAVEQGGSSLVVQNCTVPQDAEGDLAVNFLFDVDNTYTAYSFNIELPEGLEFLMDEGTDIAFTPGTCHDGSHAVTANLSEGLAKVAALSLQSRPLSGSSGTLLTFKVRATKTFETGTVFQGKLKDVLIVAVDGTKQRLADSDFTITIGVPSGIVELTDAILPFDVYTVTGIKVRQRATSLSGLPQGVYIVNGRKVVVKALE